MQRLQRPGGQRQATRGLAHAQVHPARGQAGQQVEGLGHLVRGVVAQHYPARSNADARGLCQYPGRQHFRRNGISFVEYDIEKNQNARPGDRRLRRSRH